jgi:hypothetical protein
VWVCLCGCGCVCVCVKNVSPCVKSSVCQIVIVLLCVCVCACVRVCFLVLSVYSLVCPSKKMSIENLSR